MKDTERSSRREAALVTRPENGPLALDDPRSIAQLRFVLQAANYTERAILDALKGELPLTFRLADLPVYLRRLEKRGPLSTLIKLFYLGTSTETEAADRAFAPLAVEQLQAMGLLKADAGNAVATVRLTPCDGLIVASDRYTENYPQLPSDHVTSVNATSVTLANLTVRRSVQAALDVGTGCGIQALLAARHSGLVVATDISPRALNLTAFNAMINGASNIEGLLGNMFEPVRGRLFDLIVCNPPYVISPEARYQYRDSGLPGDAVCRDLVREAPAMLREGGFAHMLCNWVHKADKDWSAPLRRWVEGSQCDVWLLRFRTEDPLAYAAKWNRPLQLAGPAAYEEALERWLNYYQRLEIEAISSGAIILRRRSGSPNWVRSDDVPYEKIGPAGDHILRVFENQDFLWGLPDDQGLLDKAFRLSENHRLEQTLTYQDGGYVTSHSVLRLENGLRFEGRMDALSMHLLSRCDGQRRLGDIVAELASTTDAELGELTAAVLTVVRRLVELGFLAPM